MGNMTIRRAEEKDCDAIVRLLGQLDYLCGEESVLDKIRGFSNDDNEKLLVAEDNGIILGFLSIHFIPQIALEGDFARISYFCVDAEHRSEGIGDLMESHCAQIARERGCDRIEVHCHSRRSDAHRFYVRQGYEEAPKYFIKQLKGK